MFVIVVLFDVWFVGCDCDVCFVGGEVWCEWGGFDCMEDGLGDVLVKC